MALLAVPVAATPASVISALDASPLPGWRAVPPHLGLQRKWHTRISLLSWSDSVQAEVHPRPGGAVVLITSQPRFQLFNWGQDARNVAAVARLVLAVAGTEARP
jgi:hypothetical protein